ncbi:MAG: DUF1015 domain-containing protein [Desulfuromonas sp.]|nr:MAG: DUF1015 domain-containing protein [Desulfuromonas sp.]
MAKISPFRALRYNPKKIDKPANVMAPPYDVISPEMQENLYQRSPWNVVRLILGKTNENDGDNDNRYSRAAAEFTAWQKEEVLQRDERPSLYLYDQEYPGPDGQPVVRKGFMALTRLEDFSSGVVKPHEKTLSGPKTDRLNLTKACKANFSPIFSLYSDPCCVLETLTRHEKAHPPALEVADDDGVLHRLWPISEPALLDKAYDLLESKPLFIADGHHRYETALNYRNYRREQDPDFTGRELYNYVLMYFANMEDQGMTIFPTHRLIHGLADVDVESLLSALKEHFEIRSENVDPTSTEGRTHVRETLQREGEKGHSLVCYAGKGIVYYLGLRDEAIMDRYFPTSAPKALRTLDVSILHRLILEEHLGITLEAQEKQTHLKYVKNFDDPFTMVDSGDYQLAFLMNATKMSEVRDVANAGEKMPQKSTYFYPKLLTGLVINSIADGESVEG